jgi:hypothetical protein
VEPFLGILLKIGLGVIVSLLVTAITKGAKTVGSHLLLSIRGRNSSREKMEGLQNKNSSQSH